MLRNNSTIKEKIKHSKKRKEIFQDTNLLEKNEEKYDKRLKAIKTILLKKTNKRTLNENRILLSFLIENFDYFKNIKKEQDEKELFYLSSALKLEFFHANKRIITYGEQGDKFYLIINGKVALFKPELKTKKMTIEDYINFALKYNNKTGRSRFEKMVELNKHLKVDYFLLNKSLPNDPILKVENYFEIIEDEFFGTFSIGFTFGETALLNKSTRNATIKAITDTECLTLNQEDYQKIMGNVETNRLFKKFLIFKKNYTFFEFWDFFQCVKIFNCVKEIQLTKGDYLYKQNEISNCIYLLKSGTYEMFSLISYGWVKKYLEYIVNSKYNLMRSLYNIGYVLSEKDADLLFQNLFKRIEKSPCVYNPNKLSDKVIENFNENNYLDIFNKNKEIKDDCNLFKMLIRIIDKNEVLGVEDSFYLKQRFCCVKVLSEHAIAEKIYMNDLFQVMNINSNEEYRKKVLELVANQKSFLYNQLVKNIKCKMIFLNEKFNLNYENRSKFKNKIKNQINDKQTEFILEKVNYNKPNKEKEKFLFEKSNSILLSTPLSKDIKNQYKNIKKLKLSIFNSISTLNKNQDDSKTYRISSSQKKEEPMKLFQTINKSLNLLENYDDNINNKTLNHNNLELNKENKFANSINNTLMTEIFNKPFKINNENNNEEIYNLKNLAYKKILNNISNLSTSENFKIPNRLKSAHSRNKISFTFQKPNLSLNDNNLNVNKKHTFYLKKEEKKNLNYLQSINFINRKKVYILKNFNLIYDKNINIDKEKPSFKLINEKLKFKN